MGFTIKVKDCSKNIHYSMPEKMQKNGLTKKMIFFVYVWVILVPKRYKFWNQAKEEEDGEIGFPPFSFSFS